MQAWLGAKLAERSCLAGVPKYPVGRLFGSAACDWVPGLGAWGEGRVMGLRHLGLGLAGEWVRGGWVGLCL